MRRPEVCDGSMRRGAEHRALASAGLVLAMGMLGSMASVAADTAITVVLSEEPARLDPCTSTLSTIGRVNKQNINETLTEINAKDGSVLPRLATAWKQMDDLTWRFELRPGVKFHDGTDFNAAAAAYSIDRTLDESIDCDTRIKFFGGMKLTATAVDDHTLEVKSEQPIPIMPVLLGTLTIMSTKTPMGEITREPVGTGPYRLASWTPGTNIVLERFDGYWGDKPPVSKVTYVWRTESAVRAAMVKTGEADIAPNIAVQDATDAAMDVSYPNSETSRLRIDMTRAPLDNRDLRMALNLAVDRDAIRGSILSKDVLPATQLVVPGINGHNPELKPWPYDPEKARQLVEKARQAGAPVDKEILMVGRTNIYPNATEVMEALMAMYQQIGLNVRMKMFEVSEWLDQLVRPYAEDRPPTLLQAQHDNNNGDAVFTMYSKYHCDGGNSMTCDAKLDDLMERAAKAVGDERRELFQEAFRMIHEDLISDVELFHMVGYTRVGPRLSFVPDVSTNSELQIGRIAFK